MATESDRLARMKAVAVVGIGTAVPRDLTASQTKSEPLTLSSLSDWPSDLTSPVSRIHAVQFLRAVLELNQSLDPATETQTETLDARLVSLLMRLPLTPSITDASTIDEMAFQALMITYLYAFRFHPLLYHPSYISTKQNHTGV